jgi:hypothetical protein
MMCATPNKQLPIQAQCAERQINPPLLSPFGYLDFWGMHILMVHFGRKGV